MKTKKEIKTRLEKGRSKKLEKLVRRAFGFEKIEHEELSRDEYKKEEKRGARRGGEAG